MLIPSVPRTRLLPVCAGSPSYKNGTSAASPKACCAICAADPHCTAWIAADSDGTEEEGVINCWPLASAAGTTSKKLRTFGQVRGSSSLSDAIVTDLTGKVLYSGKNTFTNASKVAANHLHWPSPLDAPSYAFSDS